jgi:serine/threonine-protein kinase
VGRYALYGDFAHGGMATVHLGRLLGPVGFARTVAIKRLHPQYAKDPDFVSMFVDEARLAARIRHPNVVATLDVVVLDGELFLVMDYVQGETLARLLRLQRERREQTPVRVALAVITQVLAGLHAAHETRNERSEPIGLVHRDMSPQNVIVGVDGVARVLDFGIAKAEGRVQTTREGQLKGKLSYVAPEQLKGDAVDRRTDVYAAAVTLWEVLTGRRLFKAESEWQLVNLVMEAEVQPPSVYAPHIPPELDALVMRGLSRAPEDRFASAFEMALALERIMPLASAREVGEWAEVIGGHALARRAALVSEIETDSALTNVVSVQDLRGSISAIPTPTPSGVASVVTTMSRVPSIRPETGFHALRTVPPVAAKPGRTWPAALLLTLAGGALAGYAIMTMGPSAAPPSRATSLPVQPIDYPPPPTASLEPPPAASAAPAPSTAARLNPPPAAPPVAAARSATAAAPAASIVSPTASAPAPDCSPPYTVDKDGIRHPKAECL